VPKVAGRGADHREAIDLLGRSPYLDLPSPPRACLSLYGRFESTLYEALKTQ
jgi:hypothetical protein